MSCCSNISSNNTIALDILIIPISPLKNVSLRRNRNIVFFSNTTKIRKQYLKQSTFMKFQRQYSTIALAFLKKKHSKLSGKSNI